MLLYDISVDTGNFNLKVKVKVKNNTLKYEINVQGPETDFLHPFRYITDNKSTISEVVADNTLTRTLFEYLVMSDNELRTVCGNNHVIEYRACIIKSIDLLWN